MKTLVLMLAAVGLAIPSYSFGDHGMRSLERMISIADRLEDSYDPRFKIS